MATPIPSSKVRSLNCPNCGGAIELRGFAHTRTAVCIQCLSVLDATAPSLVVLQQFDERMRVKPLIPLGKRGKLGGHTYEVIGFQVRGIEVDGVTYSWHEYLLFNPYQGFRYLTQYDGHWTDIVTLPGLPQYTTGRLGRKAAQYEGRLYQHFQSARATTSFVMGEFPWQVRVGDAVDAEDFTAPPYSLSAEKTEGEVTWSRGEYLTGQQVWTSFALPGAPPPARGVYFNQPSPHEGKTLRMWRTFLLLAAAWLLVAVFFLFRAANKEVFRESYQFAQSSSGEHSFVTGYFELDGGTRNVEVELRTNLENNWAYFHMSLINESTGQGFDFGREVSYYSGRDSDGAWSEGSRRDTVVLPRIPEGKYYLLVEPDMQGADRGQSVRYEIVVRRDVPAGFWLFVAFPLLLIPPVVGTVRAAAFESARWNESDYAPSGGDDDDDED